MPIVKKRNQQTETRLLLESDEPVELPPAEIDERSVLVQFEKFKRFIPELLDVKLWHAAGTEMTKIDRAQVISCLPSTRGVQVVVEPPEE
jgi:hypothetical protein